METCHSSLSKLQFNRNIIKPEFRACKNPCVPYKEKFVGAVNQFLQFYQGSQLSLFAIKCCLGREWTSDIDGWVRFALGRGTEKLTLHFYCNKFCSSNDKDKNGRGVEGKYVLESELFDGLETSNLKHLNLVACNLGENFTCQFTCLESLVLYDSSSSLYHLNSMFSSLSKLKILIFGWCILPKKLFLNLLPLLQRLEVRGSNGLEEIEFLNVNLVTSFRSGSEIQFPPGPWEQPWDKRERLMVTQRLEKFAKDKEELVIG